MNAYGNIKNITNKLDYFEELGIGGLWITPLYESPTYHGYDSTDYYKIKPEYGTMEDFEELVAEAHARDIKIILDWALNHTSLDNEWFKKSAAGDPKYRDWYRWSDVKRYDEVTPMNSDPWTYLNGAYYYNSFWSGMPNLNHSNPEVREELINVAKFWLSKNIDGFRMDATLHTFFDVDKSVEFWEWFKTELREIKEDVYLVSEAWGDSIEISQRFDNALGSSFNFDLAADIIDKANWGCIKHIGTNFDKNYNLYFRNNQNVHNSIFLSNHDQNRIYSELRHNKDNMKIAATILLTFSGTPYIYYGEEIGTLGVKLTNDENVRRPMNWEEVEIQKHQPNSLLNFYKTLINLRNNEVALRLGDFKNIETKDDGCLMFKRIHNEDEIIVIINQCRENVQEIEDGKYKVLYSNRGYEKIIDTRDYLCLDQNEILIIKKVK
jgi:glycosidase